MKINPNFWSGFIYSTILAAMLFIFIAVKAPADELRTPAQQQIADQAAFDMAAKVQTGPELPIVYRATQSGVILTVGSDRVTEKSIVEFQSAFQSVVAWSKSQPELKSFANKKFMAYPYLLFSTKEMKDLFVTSYAAKKGRDAEWLKASLSYNWMELGDFNFISMADPTATALIQFATARNLIVCQFDKKPCPEWLMQGFPTMYQYLTTGKDGFAARNSYRGDTSKKKWNVLVKEAASAGQLKPWGLGLNQGLSGLSDVDYAVYRSVTQFLYLNPKAFVKMIALIESGEVMEDAMSKAYGKSVQQLQSAWGAWIFTQN